MSYLDSGVIDKLRLILPKERIILYNAFSNKFAKFMFVSSHYSALFRDRKKVINVFQTTPRWITKKILSRRVINIFTNHGWGTKKSPGNLESLDRSKIRGWRRLRKNTDYVICNSDFDASYFMRHEFLDDLPLPKFIPLGHPRNDFLVSNACNVNLIEEERKKLGIPEFCKVVLFAPTHRESFYLGRDEYDVKLLVSYLSELKKLDQYLSDNRIFLLFRPHYYFKDVQCYKFKNIRIVTSKDFPDPRPLMLVSDILITDYSSIYVDYLLLQRPILFYQPDIRHFQEVRGLVVDPDNPLHMPGSKINKLSDILEIDENDFQKYDLNASRSFFHKYHDDKATERLANFLNSILEERVLEDYA